MPQLFSWGIPRLSKNPFGAFRQTFAVCCAHSLCAIGAQLAHLQPEMYFRSGTRPDRKWLKRYLPHSRQTLRGFFDTLRISQLFSWGIPINQGFRVDRWLFSGYNVRVDGVWRSLVSRLVRVQEASGSNPDTPAKENSIANGCFAVLFLYLWVFSKLLCNFWFWLFFGKIEKSKQKGKQWPIFSPKNSLQEAQKNRPADNWTAFPKGETHIVPIALYENILGFFRSPIPPNCLPSIPPTQ